MATREQIVAQIAESVIATLRAQMQSPSVPEITKLDPGDGVFDTVNQAVAAASQAQKELSELDLDARGRLVGAIRRVCLERADELARMELNESGLGRLDHKTEKLKAVRYVLGVEALHPEARSDSSGLCLIEPAPWGVIGMVLPATHSVPTMASNAINVLSAGNTAVFSPHPAASKVATYALRLFNREIERETGITNAITTMREASIQSAEELFHHPGIALLCVTGGPSVVQAAMRSGKRVIAAGPGNPPVVVDDSADLNAAAKHVIEGASFDNNLLCIAEKEVFVVAGVAEAFIAAMRRAGAFQLDASATERLTRAVFRSEGQGNECASLHVNRDFIGKDASVLASVAGVRIPVGTVLLFGETPEDHPFVQQEQMMPFLPVVRVPDLDAAIAAAVKAEHGCRHTALIHSRNLENVTRMARAVNTTLFIHNAPCSAALGLGGAGYLSFSIATPTGEGVTTPLTFTRQRQLLVGNALRIV